MKPFAHLVFQRDSLGYFRYYDFIRTSGLDAVSITILTPYVGTPQRDKWIDEKRLMAHVPWSMYDTNHVTYHPAQMSAEQLARGYDWLAGKLYGAPGIATRGLRQLMRQPLRDWPRKAFNSFSTDFGYRLEGDDGDEIGRVAMAYNQMLDSVERQLGKRPKASRQEPDQPR